MVRCLESVATLVERLRSEFGAPPALQYREEPPHKRPRGSDVNDQSSTDGGGSEAAIVTQEVLDAFFFAINCQMGRGRTTTAMVVACLWYVQRMRAHDRAELCGYVAGASTAAATAWS